MAGFGQDKTKKGGSSKRQKQRVSEQDLEAIAINHHIRGNLIEAEKGYREAIRAGQRSYATISNLGVICKNSGRSDEAISLYKLAIKLNPSEASTYINLGNLYADIGKFEDALILCQKSLELKSNNSAEAYLTQGWCQRNLGKFDQALTSTQKSLKLKPDHPTAHMNLGSIYKDLGMLDHALVSTQKSLELKPDNPDAIKNLSIIYMDLGRLDNALASIQTYLKLNPDDPNGHADLGVIYYKLGKLEQAHTSTVKSLELKPDDAIALMNLGSIYKDLGMLDHALVSTQKSLELKPDNPDAHVNLGSIYKHLGRLDQALASTIKSLQIQPESARGLCKLGQIKMALGQKEEAKKDLINAIRYNNEECEPYLTLSMMLETAKDAEEIIELTKSVRTNDLSPQSKLFTEFALANCHHKLENYDQASSHLQTANENKLIIYPSNRNAIIQAIKENHLHFNSEKTDIDQANGNKRIFIVGMPRSGSTLLETTLSINKEVKDLGESRSLKKAISLIKQGNPGRKNLDEIYSQLEPIKSPQIRYTTDKNLYNFIYIGWIINHMPAAKVIHCHRNPMDNILSMYRSNLSAGNNYTSDLEDAAKILVAQNTIMETYRKNHPKQIFSFSYDKFVNQPKENLSELLAWLSLDFDENQLRPEASTRNINTASLIQSRNPISNKSVGGWKNYKDLLKPALKIIQECGIMG